MSDKKVYVLKKVVWKAREEDGWDKSALDEWEESVNKEFTSPDALHKYMWKFVEKPLIFEGRLYYSFDDRGEELPGLMDMLNDKLKTTKYQIVQRTYPYVGNHGLFIKGPDGKYLSGKDKVPKKVQNIVDKWWDAIYKMKDKEEYVEKYNIDYEWENPAYLGDIYVEKVDKELKESYKDFDDIWPIDGSPYAKSPGATIGSSFMLVEVNPRQYRPIMDGEEWDSELERAIDLEVRFDIEVYEIKDGKKIAIQPGDENEEFYGDITSYAKGGAVSGYPKMIKLQNLLKWYSGSRIYDPKVLTLYDGIGVNGGQNTSDWKFQEEVDWDMNRYLKDYRNKKVKVYIEENPNQNYDYTFQAGDHIFILFDAVSVYPKIGLGFEKGGKVEKKGNEIIIGGLAGILLGVFFNK